MIDFSSIWQYLSQPDTIVTMFALSVSIAAIYFSVKYNRKTLELTVENNMLSVKPLFTSFYDHDFGDGKILFRLANNGLGPAKIIEIKYEYLDFYNSDVFELIKTLGDIGKIPFFFSLQDTGSRKVENHWIPEKSSLNLFTSILETRNEGDMKEFMKIIGQIEISVTYRDIYGKEDSFKELFIVDTKKTKKNDTSKE